MVCACMGVSGYRDTSATAIGDQPNTISCDIPNSSSLTFPNTTGNVFQRRDCCAATMAGLPSWRCVLPCASRAPRRCDGVCLPTEARLSHLARQGVTEDPELRFKRPHQQIQVRAVAHSARGFPSLPPLALSPPHPSIRPLTERVGGISNNIGGRVSSRGVGTRRRARRHCLHGCTGGARSRPPWGWWRIPPRAA
jgi:hypothetical protein